VKLPAKPLATNAIAYSAVIFAPNSAGARRLKHRNQCGQRARTPDYQNQNQLTADDPTNGALSFVSTPLMTGLPANHQF